MTATTIDKDTPNDLPFYNLDDLPASALGPLAVAIGIFDGVHRGHQALLQAAVRTNGADTGVTPAALTFAPHPSRLFAPARAPRLLGTISERVALLHRYGAAHVVLARFDRTFAALTPEAFVREMLLHRLQARTVVVGSDFRFGCDRTGDAAYLQRAGDVYGFNVVVVPPVLVEGIPARSSVIRQMVAGGAMGEAATLLGRPFALGGTVVYGKQLGHTIGYPTANIASPGDLLVPSPGVYACRATINGETYRAAVSIGTNPTVDDRLDAPQTVEAYLLDFAGDLYGQYLTLEFVARLRGMEKFDGLDALITQMARDVDETRRLVA